MAGTSTGFLPNGQASFSFRGLPGLPGLLGLLGLRGFSGFSGFSGFPGLRGGVGGGGAGGAPAPGFLGGNGQNALEGSAGFAVGLVEGSAALGFSGKGHAASEGGAVNRGPGFGAVAAGAVLLGGNGQNVFDDFAPGTRPGARGAGTGARAAGFGPS